MLLQVEKTEEEAMRKRLVLLFVVAFVALVGLLIVRWSGDRNAHAVIYEQTKQTEAQLRSLKWGDMVRMETGELGLIIQEAGESSDRIGIALRSNGTETRWLIMTLSYRKMSFIRKEDSGYKNALEAFINSK